MRHKMMHCLQALVNMTHLFETVASINYEPQVVREENSYLFIEDPTVRKDFEQDIMKMIGSFREQIKAYQMAKQLEQSALEKLQRESALMQQER